MKRRILLLASLLLAVPLAHGQDASRLGLKLAAVPESAYEKMPVLARGQGVLVQEATGAAARVGLKEHDIVFAVGNTPVNSASALTARLQSLRPGEREILEVLRDGRTVALSWPDVGYQNTVDNAYTPPKSFLKPGGPPAVSVQVHPLPRNEYDITILYNTPKSGKIERHAFQGTVGTIEQQIHDCARRGEVPVDVQDLIGVALDRLRTRNQQK